MRESPWVLPTLVLGGLLAACGAAAAVILWPAKPAPVVGPAPTLEPLTTATDAIPITEPERDEEDEAAAPSGLLASDLDLQPATEDPALPISRTAPLKPEDDDEAPSVSSSWWKDPNETHLYCDLCVLSCPDGPYIRVMLSAKFSGQRCAASPEAVDLDVDVYSYFEQPYWFAEGEPARIIFASDRKRVDVAGPHRTWWRSFRSYRYELYGQERSGGGVPFANFVSMLDDGGLRLVVGQWTYELDLEHESAMEEFASRLTPEPSP